MGFPLDLIEMVCNVYTGATTKVLTPHGLTDSILIYAGVKQGCPLSTILFNLAIELILRETNLSATSYAHSSAKHHSIGLSVLAYADDLVIIACHKDVLQHLLDQVSSAADTLCLDFQLDKCASLSM